MLVSKRKYDELNDKYDDLLVRTTKLAIKYSEDMLKDKTLWFVGGFGSCAAIGIIIEVIFMAISKLKEKQNDGK